MRPGGSHAARHAALVVVSLLMLLPFYWVLRTATTDRSSYSAGMPGNSDATWPSGPMPSSMTSNDGTGP